MTDREAASPQTGAEAVSSEEIDQQAGEELPDRDQMSLVNLNLAAPINAAVAANVLSDGATAYANAAQGGTFLQKN